jgi:hypothetical protein
MSISVHALSAGFGAVPTLRSFKDFLAICTVEATRA